jgi:hypothetical protein
MEVAAEFDEAAAQDVIAGSLGAAMFELDEAGIAPGEVLFRVLHRLPQRYLAPHEEFQRRQELEFEVRSDRLDEELFYVDQAERDGTDRFVVSGELALSAVMNANASLLALEQFTRSLSVPVSELLGLRNLSSLVSAVVVSEIQGAAPTEVYINPHQDGYPDLIPSTITSLNYAAEMDASGRHNDKSAWTDPGFGGIEVKATCGDTPPARLVAKPGLGVERSPIVRGFTWKAHHRETSRLFGVIWDFVDTVPTITGAYFRNDLAEGDWGDIVKPREGGGRTTSVSIMTRTGMKKMAEGWMVLVLDPSLRGGLGRGGMLPPSTAIGTH